MHLSKKQLSRLKAGTVLVEDDWNETEWMKIFNQRFIRSGDENIYHARNLATCEWKKIVTPRDVEDQNKEILDEAEKRYLKAIIRPFRSRVKAIARVRLIR